MEGIMLKIYSASWCSHCKKLKEFLKNKNIEFFDIDIDEDLEEAMMLIKEGYKTIPQVFYNNGVHIGGCDITIDKFK